MPPSILHTDRLFSISCPHDSLDRILLSIFRDMFLVSWTRIVPIIWLYATHHNLAKQFRRVVPPVPDPGPKTPNVA